jgi:DNA-binding transcriptional MerR regulator/quercetin dioxygenase-like cupin family protein
MAYTVKQVAAMSGVSVRTLHFYDETGLLKPAYVGENGYRFYDEPQLLTLQQILFYRELGFELKQIQRILGRADFERIAALQSHREVLRASLARTHKLIATIDKTIQHVEGTKKMTNEEMFAGFSVAAGDDRFGAHIRLGDEPDDCQATATDTDGVLSIFCKVSAKDTDGALCVFEFTGGGGGPRHLHHAQDEWIYVIDGEIDLLLGEKHLRLGAGESVFIPRKVAHVWGCVPGRPSKIVNVYQPAGQMEEFFRAVGRTEDLPTREQVVNQTYTEQQKNVVRQLFEAHGMQVLGPPRIVEGM